MRLFVAVNLPDAERHALAEALSGLSRGTLPVRWTARDGLHITMKFLGEVDDALAAPLGEALAPALADVKPFDLSLGGFGAFPSLEQPRVLWVGVERHPALELLANDVERALAGFGFAPELKPFQPHITVGRVKKDARAAALKPLARRVVEFAYEGTMIVEGVDLMRSTPGASGSRYEVVRRAPLGGGSTTRAPR